MADFNSYFKRIMEIYQSNDKYYKIAQDIKTSK
jgi:hypothetical protein